MQTYPPLWSEWLKLDNDLLNTNQEIIENPELQKVYGDVWFNPFTQPDRLAEQRQQLGMTGLDWQRYCEQNYPGIDSKEQKRLRIDERKSKRKSNCGTWQYKKSVEKPGMTERVRWYCKCPDCDICNQRKAKNIEEELNNISGKVYTVTQDQLEAIKKTRTKDDYKQINDEATGQIKIVLKHDDKVEGLNGVILTKTIAKELAQTAIACESKRMSGNLGSSPIVAKEKKEGPVYSIRRRRYEMELTEESTIKGSVELDELVLEQFEKVTETTEDVLQDAIYRLEQLTQQIAEKHCAKIHFLGIETVNVYLVDIDWTLILKE